MKKLLAILGVCFLLAIMPINFAKSTTTLNLVQNNTDLCNKDFNKISLPTDDPPQWANGNFSGLWGLDIWGE